MGGRGASSGINNGNDNGAVAIYKMPDPNSQGHKYYVSGSREVITNWDESGNYHPEGMKIKERIAYRADTKEEAIQFAKNNGFKYISL